MYFYTRGIRWAGVLVSMLILAACAAPTPVDTEVTARPQPAVAAAGQPTVRPGLEATDPQTFQLASGQVQLVELFAFW